MTTGDNDAPIMVTGPNRSGTTWMQWFLSQHPRIHIHGQSPNTPWHFFWSVSQTMIDHGEWARRANLHVGYDIAHYAGSPPDRARRILLRAIREYLTGFGPEKPRWGVKWLDLCAAPGAADQVEWLWPGTRWVVCLRDPFVTIESTRNTFVPNVDDRLLAETWVRTCQFVEANAGPRVVLFQMDKLGQATEDERRAALRRVMDCVGEEWTDPTERFLREWPVVHKVRRDEERPFVMSYEARRQLLDDVPGLAPWIRRMGYDVPENDPSPASTAAPRESKGNKGSTRDVLINFRHGLGDAVQLTCVLEHLRHYRPDWNVDVAALAGKHSLFSGLCRKVHVLGHQRVFRSQYDRVFDLDWEECATCYAGWPSTKAERCLLEVFRLTPLPEKCRYVIHPSPRAAELARRYLEGTCKVTPGEDGRYPVVLIHYEGNTSGQFKNLPVPLVRRLCDDVLQSGAVPVILDWDSRTPLADGKRIFNPHVDLELWGGIGTGDGEVLAALTELSRLMVGVDSGPLHVAGATSTPTLGVWTRHHPLHYFAHADNVVHLVPENHRQWLRGDPDAGAAYFDRHYRCRTYANLEGDLRDAVRSQLRDQGGLVSSPIP